ncbi:MAG: methylmalonyl Co-A mutase-associated GTPase MeaB, partial [Synergistaceae bacterium]|nr:methylmalonyl Co-A mutase-associated GTPase MeaB [Synergistaceae bacterium]
VGVGQSEIDVVKVCDTVCLILVPGLGDDVQIMKAGVMEVADIFVVNKSDRDGASKVAADVKVMLDLVPQRQWRPPVSLASARLGEGMDEIITNLSAHRDYLTSTDEGKSRRMAKIGNQVEEIVKRGISSRVESAWRKESRGGALEDIQNRRTDPYAVAENLLNKIMK